MFHKQFLFLLLAVIAVMIVSVAVLFLLPSSGPGGITFLWHQLEGKAIVGASEGDWVDCGAVEVQVIPATPNKLVVESYISGVFKNGVNIEHVSGSPEAGGETRYEIESIGAINVELEAPLKFMGADFHSWEWCDNVQDQKCEVMVVGGQTKTIKVYYEYGEPEWREV